MPDCWLPGTEGSHFPVQALPYGVFSRPGQAPRVGVAIGAHVLDLAPALSADGERAALVEALARPALDGLLALGPPAWAAVRSRVTGLLTDPTYRPVVEPHLVPQDQVRLHLPFTVADFVDFYASRHHAENMGRILRPGTDPLPAAWRELPIGYHGRAGTVVVSGTPVRRPCGLRRVGEAPRPAYGPTERLDLEAEVGFVVGVPSALGTRVPTTAWREHVFGVVLVNDWSARDVQAVEYVPLGPFLAKSFATSVSAWVLPLAALDAAWLPPPVQDPEPAAYLRPPGPGLDLELTVWLNGAAVSQPRSAGLYWTPAQQLAHLTANGAALRTGDLYASGTVSGPERDQRGSLMELTWGGTEPLPLPDGSRRTFLADGDTVTITATAPGADGVRVHLGPVTGDVLPATPPLHEGVLLTSLE